MPLYEVRATNLNGERGGALSITAESPMHAMAHAHQRRTGLRFDVDAQQFDVRPAGSTDLEEARSVDDIRDWMYDKKGPFGVSVLNRNMAYEDDSFVELQQLPAIGPDGQNEYFTFIIQHKGSETVFEATAKDRDELAAKIASGQYEDVDPRNDKTPADLKTDATDE